MRLLVATGVVPVWATRACAAYFGRPESRTYSDVRAGGRAPAGGAAVAHGAVDDACREPAELDGLHDLGVEACGIRAGGLADAAERLLFIIDYLWSSREVFTLPNRTLICFVGLGAF